MTLWLRRTGLASPADADRADYLVIEHDKVIGRIYEERYVPADVRWFWSITEHVDPALGIVTNGRVPSLEEAKARFESSWSKVREAQEQQRPEGYSVPRVADCADTKPGAASRRGDRGDEAFRAQ